MSFALSKLLWLLVEPGNLLLLLLALGALLLFRRRRMGRWLVGIAAVAGIAVAVLPLGAWLLVPLEARFPPPVPLPAEVDGIVVLGGAVDAYLAEAREQPALNEQAERVVALVDLARRYPQARLVYSGGSGSPWSAAYREADAARPLLARLGLDTSRVVFERESRNTHENAVQTLALAQPEAGETWLLVTSAWHMPRAVGCFRRLDWAVTPYPVDYQTDGSFSAARMPDLTGGLAA
ncbi:MAG TPA: YdcF family protein, partial [Dongiaceae bacterium]|nr:YdcF family protein [Dongiaceae bacterium]